MWEITNNNIEHDYEEKDVRTDCESISSCCFNITYKPSVNQRSTTLIINECYKSENFTIVCYTVFEGIKYNNTTELYLQGMILN